MRLHFGALTIAGLCVMAVGCSSAPPPPQPGTPAFYWGAAKSTYQAGDFLKASDNLSQITKSDNEFTVRALPWSMVLSNGIAQGYMELADNFEAGARANRANPMPFRRQATIFRGYASAAALQSAETMHKFLATTRAESIPLEFDYPTGSAAEPVQLQRVAKGMLFPPAEIETLQKAMVQRGVLFSAVHAVGAGEDAAKALEIFKKGGVTIPRPAFLLAMARSLHEQADLFSPKKLDQPNRVKTMCIEAEAALNAVPDSKEKKDLLSQIAKLRKLAKVT